MVFRRGSKKKDTALILLGQAEEAGRSKEWDKAMEFAGQAREYCEKHKDDEGFSKALALYFEYKGYKALETGDHIEAATAIGRAVAFYTKMGMEAQVPHLIEAQASSFKQAGKYHMSQRRFLDAAADFEQAALAYFKLKKSAEQLESRAKAYVCRAAGEKTLAGRKNFLKQAIDMLEQAGIRTPLVRGHLEYYTALFNRLENPAKALPHLQAAAEYYAQAGRKAKVREVKQMISQIEDIPSEQPRGFTT